MATNTRVHSGVRGGHSAVITDTKINKTQNIVGVGAVQSPLGGAKPSFQAIIVG